MKRNYFFILLIAVLMTHHIDAQPAGATKKAKKNLENAGAVTKMIESKDFSKMGDYISTDIVDHSGPGGEMKGLESLKAMFQQYSGMTKDVKVDVIQQMANDEYVMMWLKQSWTSTVDEPSMGLKAGERGSMTSVEVTRHNADGKITEHWSFMAMEEVMKMMSGMNKQKKD